MNISKRKKVYARTLTPPARRLPALLDEFHLFAPCGANAELLRHVGSNKPPALMATQAIITRNSGKRIRFVSTMTWANGDPLRPAKAKFFPVQCLRRQAQKSSLE